MRKTEGGEQRTEEGMPLHGHINRNLIVVTDEYLDYQAERFRFWHIVGLLNISFVRFLDDPDGYILMATQKIKDCLGANMAVVPEPAPPVRVLYA
ncbi:MAG: hypothetical protein AB9866_11045 [Syntrophobacteraceae bacterium]